MRYLIIAFTLGCFTKAYAQHEEHYLSPSMASYMAYECLHLPDLKRTPASPGVIKIAIIDNGFNLSHRSLKPFVYKNPKELEGNGKDDDGNGYIDDLTGWDLADKDADVSLHVGRESFFTHGTMIAGIVTRVAEYCFGSNAPERIKIVPVKVMGDQYVKSNYELGYEGIAYAVKMNVDIIVCAWNGGMYDSEKYDPIFLEAQKKGILILASSGNFYSEKCEPPASISSVYVVSAVDSQRIKLKASNYGREVDLVAPGVMVYAPHPSMDNGYAYLDGTSAAVALVSGCAAALKALDKTAGPELIMNAMKNTASPVDSMNRRIGAKLGAGIPDLGKAVTYLLNETDRNLFFDPHRPEGYLDMNRKSSTTSWQIEPYGGIRGFYFNISNKWKDRKTPIHFYSGDSLMASYLPANFPENVFIPGNNITVSYRGGKGKAHAGLYYEADPVDSTTLYCRETKYLENPEGSITDGSGNNNYTNNCACKWQINAPAGKRIKIVFDKMDIQPKLDFISLFDGEYAIPENMLASFSGADLPPLIISRSNKLLVWFVTDDVITAQGWQLRYTFTDENPGVYPNPGIDVKAK